MTIARTERGDDSRTETGPTGVVLRDPLPWHQLTQVVETAEDTGYEAVFVPEIAGREAFATLTGFACVTSRIRLGTGVIPIRSRTPVTAAMAAATVHDLSEGRMILGIGAGRLPGLERGGAGPLGQVREYVRVVRDALAGRVVEAEELLGVPTFRLELLSDRGLPIWLAALGDRMIGLAGEMADGVLLNWCTPERVSVARELLREGALRAGRDPGSLSVAVYVRACLGVDVPAALEALRNMTGQYAALPHYLRQLELMGLGEEGAVAAKAFKAGRPDEVPESLVRSLAVLGGRRDALDRFQAYRQAGADLVLCYPVAALDVFSSTLGTVLAAAPTPAIER